MLFSKREKKDPMEANKRAAAKGNDESKKDVELQEELNELAAAELPKNVYRARTEAERTISDATLSDIRDISLIERGRCPECGGRTESMVSSRVCTSCGWYRWRSQEANSCIIFLESGEKIECDRIYNVKGEQVLCVSQDVVSNIVVQSSIRRIDYVWDQEKLKQARERFHKERTGVCDWCGMELDKIDSEPLVDLAAFGAFQEKYGFCSEKCMAAFRKQYTTRIHRNCYETDCNLCTECVKRYDTSNIKRIKLKDTSA